MLTRTTSGQVFLGLCIAALMMVIAPDLSAAQSQNKDQQKCINAMNKDGAKVAATQGKENTSCIKNAGKGKEGDPDGCLTRDDKGKVEKAAGKVQADFDKKCVSDPPDFGLPAGTGAGMLSGTAAAVVSAAVEEELQLVEDVFGAPLSAAIVTDKDGAKCQSAVSKDYEKTVATYMKGFLKCKKNALKGGANSAADLEACVLDDPGGKAASTVSKLAADIGKKCTDNLFPGLCAATALDGLADCIHERVRCGVCRMQNGMDGLAVDCDAADDGANNGSCVVNPLDGLGPVTLIQDGFVFTEGPRWSTSEGVLYFTDVPEQIIYSLTLPDNVEVFRSESNGANGLAFDPEGRLVAAEGAGRRVTRTEADGSITVLADEFDGIQLHSPNDVIVRSDGTIYFTDPSFEPPLPALSFNGVFRIAPDGALFAEVQLALSTFPNGIDLSPDESVLYVTDVLGPVRAWDVASDGSLSGERVIANVVVGDGTAVDVAGNLYAAGLAGVHVFAPDGSLWGIIEVPEGPPSNCGFGGPDNRTLFITAQPNLYSARMVAPGIP